MTIIDLHCDTLTKAYDNGWSLDDSRLQFSPAKIAPGIDWTQFMAVFIPDKLRGRAAREYFERVHEFYVGAATFRPLTTVLTVEGGAVLEGNPDNVDSLWAAGVRMLTLTWNGPNELCGGVLSGGGFTDVGREAVRRMEACGMVVDVSHISDEGFWELCKFAQKPFIASHSNARKICGHPRNLTDDMFREIIARGGLVGINYYDKFVIDGGSGSVDDILRHVNHFLELGGQDVLALGSDFDGAPMPDYLSGADKIETLINALPQNVADKILYKNAMRFFGRECK